MPWYLEALSTPIRIDVQKNPAPAIILFVIVCAVLLLAVSAARRRDERRTAGRRDLSGWRSRQPPRR